MNRASTLLSAQRQIAIGSQDSELAQNCPSQHGSPTLPQCVQVAPLQAYGAPHQPFEQHG